MKLLLVDDSKIMRWDNQIALQHAGHEVICAEDGEAALDIARAQAVDIILLDLLLPKLSGLEVLRLLKTDARTAGIPVIVLSGLSGKNRGKLLEAGAEEYFEKSTLLPRPGENLLPKALDEIACRISQRKGVEFGAVKTAP